MQKFIGFVLGTFLGLATVTYAQVGGGTIYIATPVSLANGGTAAVLTDPNADRILFWDDSAGAVTWLVPTGNLAITTTNFDTVANPTFTTSITTPLITRTSGTITITTAVSGDLNLNPVDGLKINGTSTYTGAVCTAYTKGLCTSGT